MERVINTGLAAYGMSGKVFHAPLIETHSGFRLSKILERHSNESTKKYPHVNIVRTFEELLTDNEIELIVVNTPDHLHYNMVSQAIKAGKHVIAEKPFTQTTKQALELDKLANEKGVMVSVFQNRRWDGDFLTVKKVIEENLVGRLVEFEAHFDRFRNYTKPNTWKEDPATGTGTLYNLGSHMIDQALVLFGMPSTVQADIRTMRTGGSVDDNFELKLGYESEKVTLKGSYLVREPGPRYILHGTEGSFLKWGLDPQEAALTDGELPDKPGWGEEDSRYYGLLNTDINGLHFKGKIETIAGNYLAFYDDIYNALTTGIKPAVTAIQASDVIRIIEAAFESHENQKAVLL